MVLAPEPWGRRECGSWIVTGPQAKEVRRIDPRKKEMRSLGHWGKEDCSSRAYSWGPRRTLLRCTPTMRGQPMPHGWKDVSKGQPLPSTADLPASLETPGKPQEAACLASPSRDMPSARHFCRRQCWHRFRLVRSMGQFCWRVQE